MNLVFGFTIREVSEVKDSDQVLTIPMYLSVHWIVSKVQPTFIIFEILVETQENRLVIDPNHRSWKDNSTGPTNETTEEAEVYYSDRFICNTTLFLQTLKNLWKPNLEIYGLEAFTNHKILGDMAGLRITKGKAVKYDIK